MRHLRSLKPHRLPHNPAGSIERAEPQIPDSSTAVSKLCAKRLQWCGFRAHGGNVHGEAVPPFRNPRRPGREPGPPVLRRRCSVGGPAASTGREQLPTARRQSRAQSLQALIPAGRLTGAVAVGDRADGVDRGGASQAGQTGVLRPQRPRHRLRGAAGHRGRAGGAVDRRRVRTPAPAHAERGPGLDLRSADPPALERAGPRRPGPGAHLRQAAAAQARRRSGQAELRPERPRRRYRVPRPEE